MAIKVFVKRVRVFILVVFALFLVSDGLFARGLSDKYNFNFFFVNLNVPVSWKRVKGKGNFPNSAFFVIENRNVKIMFFMGEDKYFEYPLIITVFPFEKPDSKKITSLVKKAFFRFMLTESERKDFRFVWQATQPKKSRLKNGNTIEFYGFSAKGTRRTLKPVVLGESIILLNSPEGSVLFFLGLKVDTGAGVYRKVSLIQRGYKENMLKLIQIASACYLEKLKRDRQAEVYLIKKGKFRHAFFSSSSINTGAFNTATQLKNKLFFDFYRDGTCGFSDESFFSYFGEFGTDLGVIKGNKSKSNKKFPFSVFKSQSGNKWLYIPMPNTSGKGVFYKLEFNKTKFVYTIDKGTRKTVKKKIKGLAINGKIEGFFSTYGAISIYFSPDRF